MTIQLDLIDLGDATTETKQLLDYPVFIDSTFFRGLLPDL